MSTISGIYKIIHRETNRIYIGQSVNIQRRWWNHTAKNNQCVHIRNALQKYGKNAFDFVILEQIDEPQRNILNQKLIDREQFWLDMLQPFGEQGFNICTKANVGPALKGIPKTGRSAIGENNKGNTPVICYDDNINIVAEFVSIRIAAKSMMLHPAGISNCCAGKVRTAGGYFWAIKGKLPIVRPKRKKLNPKHSEATKEKQRQARCRNNYLYKGKPAHNRIRVAATNNQSKQTLIFNSMHEAAKYFDVTVVAISRAVRGLTRVAGFVWTVIN